MVFKQKRQPNTTNATDSSTMLSPKKTYWAGNPVPQYTIEEIPVRPPIVIWLGSSRNCHPKAPMIMARVRRK